MCRLVAVFKATGVHRRLNNPTNLISGVVDPEIRLIAYGKLSARLWE